MEHKQTPGGASPSTKRHILVADDEATLRLGLSYTLVDDRTNVHLAEDGSKTLEILSTQQYDLLIMDLRMPGVDGISAIEALRAAGNRIPIILCSAEFAPGTFLRAVRCDVVDFLIKPANPEQIRSAVSFVMETREGTHPQAMSAARAGLTDEAIRILESAADPDTVSQGWLNVLRSLDTEDNKSERAVSEQEFAALALNAPVVA